MKLPLYGLATFLGSLALQAPVYAEDYQIRSVLTALSGTLSAYLDPMMSSGTLIGCSLVFEHLTQDSVYLGGDFLRSSGSVGLISAEGVVALSVKVIAKRVKPDATYEPERFDLARAYLINSDYTANFASLVSSYETEQAGGIFAVYPIVESAPQIFEMIESGQITVAVAPPGGGMDIRLGIDFSVTSTNDDGTRVQSQQNQQEFQNCAESLLGPLL